MKILYFTRDYTTHDRQFLEKLASSPHDIFFLRLEDDGLAYEQRPVPDRVKTIQWRGGSAPSRCVTDWLGLMAGFERVLADVRPDLVHAGPIQSCGFLSALAGFRPLMLMSWGSDLLVDAERDAAHSWITRFTLEHSDYLVCDCDAVREKAQQLCQYPDQRIVQFPWGVDLTRFKPALDVAGHRLQLGIDGEFVVLSTRLWEDIYDIDTALEALRLARASNPGIKMVLLGDGSRAPEVRRFIDRHHLGSAVVLPGLIPHAKLPEYFRAADLYVSCARSDGSSISLLEAMASGLPVVVTDTPANREWIEPGSGGQLATTGEAPVFAEAILAMAGLDDSARQAMGARNRAVAESRADWHANIARLLSVYEHIHANFSSPGVAGIR